VLEALRFLDLLGSGPWRLSQQRAARILETVSYEQLTGGRAPGQPDSRSHYRMGTAGQWRTHFGKVHELAFEKRHPGLLRWLGYEQGDDW
jgi:hypothetical protein